MRKRIVVVLALLGNACCGAIANMDYSQKKEDIEKIINVRGWLGIGFDIGNQNRDLRIFLYNKLQKSLNKSDAIKVDNEAFVSNFSLDYGADLNELASPTKIETLKTPENINKYFNSIENFYLSGEKDQQKPEDVFKELTKKKEPESKEPESKEPKKFDYLATTNDAQTAVNNAKDDKHKALYTYLYNRLITYRYEDLEETNVPAKLDATTWKDDDVAKNTGISNIKTLVGTKNLLSLKTVDNIITYFDAIEDFYLNDKKDNDPQKVLETIIKKDQDKKKEEEEQKKKLAMLKNIDDINKYITDVSNDYNRTGKLRNDTNLKNLGLDYASVLDPLYETTGDAFNVNLYLNAARDFLTLEKNDILKPKEKDDKNLSILTDLTQKLNVTKKFDDDLQKKILADDSNIITKLLKSVAVDKKERMAAQLASKNLDEFTLFLDAKNKTVTERREEKEAKQKRKELENKLKIKPFIIFNFLEKNVKEAEKALPKGISQMDKELIIYLYNALQENCSPLKLSDCSYKKIAGLNDTVFISTFNKKHFVEVADLVAENILKALKNTKSDKLEDQVAINDYLNGIYQRFIKSESDTFVVDDLFQLLGNATLKNNANQLTRPESLIGYCIKSAAELPDDNKMHIEMQMFLKKHKTDLPAYLQQFEEIVKKTNDDVKKKHEEKLRKPKEEEELRKKTEQLLKDADVAVNTFGRAINDIK